MDGHVERVTRPLVESFNELRAGNAVSLLDLSRLAEQASTALDNSVQGIPIVLTRAAADLEYAYHSTERAEHSRLATKILEPVIASLDPALAGQTFCDWCCAPLTFASVEASSRIGLAAEYSWACDRCIADRNYTRPPEAWDDEAVWPFRA